MIRGFLSHVQLAAAAAAPAAKWAELKNPPITENQFGRCDFTHLATLAAAPEQPQENVDTNGARATN